MTTTERPLAEHPLDDDEREHIWQHGYSTGRTAGLDARPPADVFVPVPITWRHVLPGDGFLGEGNTLWHVQAADIHGDTVQVAAVHGAQTFHVEVPADEPLVVLDLATERDACDLLAAQLGAHMIARRGEATVTG